MTTETQPTAAATARSLDGRIALVTGASRGIGAAIARALDNAGARVVLSARDHDALQGIAGRLSHEPLTIAADLADPEQAEMLLHDAVAQAGRVDILVNNAGIGHFAPSDAAAAADIDRLLAVNVRSVLLLAGRAAAGMAHGGGGSIVNVSSVLARGGVTRASAYAATKGALDGMTRALAAEWGPSKVRVNAVQPGITRTDMVSPLLDSDGWEAFYTTQTPLGRLGEPDDVANLVTFLASDAAAYITGQSITIDGGWGDTGRIAPGA